VIGGRLNANIFKRQFLAGWKVPKGCWKKIASGRGLGGVSLYMPKEVGERRGTEEESRFAAGGTAMWERRERGKQRDLRKRKGDGTRRDR